VHVGDGRVLQSSVHVLGDVGVEQLVGRPGEHPRHVETDVADPDDGHRVRPGEVPRLLAVRVRVVEGDEVGGPVGAFEVHARQVHRPVALGTGGEDDRVVELAHLVDLEIDADVHVADEGDPIGLHHPVQGDDDLLDARVIRRHPVPDQTVGCRKSVVDVDRHVGVVLGEDVGGIDAGRTGADDGDTQWQRHGQTHSTLLKTVNHSRLRQVGARQGALHCMVSNLAGPADHAIRQHGRGARSRIDERSVPAGTAQGQRPGGVPDGLGLQERA
jgi:hypothetical protein